MQSLKASGLVASLRERLVQPLGAALTSPFVRAVPRAVAAVVVGERCLAVRVELPPGALRPVLTQADEGSVEILKTWRAQKWFKQSANVLVLRSSERQFLTLDHPEVPDKDLPLAVRYPLGDAMEVEPEQLLTTAVNMPRVNEAQRAQVLAVGARVSVAQQQIAALTAAGIGIRHVDVTDTALRGMVLLQGSHDEGCIVMAFVGNDICIGLLWQNHFCALRTLGLPARAPRDEREFVEHLALHIQRTADHFERQATQLAVRHVMASMPALSQEAREAVRAVLPLQARLFELHQAMDMEERIRTRCQSHNDLTALACVAAARLLDVHGPQSQKGAVQ